MDDYKRPQVHLVVPRVYILARVLTNDADDLAPLIQLYTAPFGGGGI